MGFTSRVFDPSGPANENGLASPRAISAEIAASWAARRRRAARVDVGGKTDPGALYSWRLSNNRSIALFRLSGTARPIQHRTQLIGFLSGRGLFVEGLFAQLMYRSLRLVHERTLNGTGSALLAALARALSRRTGPPVKLH
jgi:hypothetical protein